MEGRALSDVGDPSVVIEVDDWIQSDGAVRADLWRWRLEAEGAPGQLPCPLQLLHVLVSGPSMPGTQVEVAHTVGDFRRRRGRQVRKTLRNISRGFDRSPPPKLEL